MNHNGKEYEKEYIYVCVCIHICLSHFAVHQKLAQHWKSTARAKSLQSCQTLWDPMDCSLPGSSVHAILQIRILHWVAMPSFRGSSRPRDRTHVSYVSCIGRQAIFFFFFFTTCYILIKKNDSFWSRLIFSYHPSLAFLLVPQNPSVLVKPKYSGLHLVIQ